MERMEDENGPGIKEKGGNEEATNGWGKWDGIERPKSQFPFPKSISIHLHPSIHPIQQNTCPPNPLLWAI
jgi:hypothetical protein